MKNCLANERFLYFFLLILLVGFLIFPKFSLAIDLNDIDLRETGKHLELPPKAVQGLLSTLNQIFTTDWIYRESSGFSTAEECLVPLVLRKTIRIQALNHLLVDAPTEVTWEIVKNTIKIARIFLTQDPSAILNELERESVKRAIAYGMSILFQNEIRVTPGAIEYEYVSQRGTKQEITIQYILIYQPSAFNKGKILIRFYSPQSIDPPRSEGGWGITGTPHSVKGKLPPFIVDVEGLVENYKWVRNPTITIDFPPEVPDLGIRPLSWWEKHILKPIESTIKDVEIIITKITGTPLSLTGAWDKIKSFITGITELFSPATVSSPQIFVVPETDSPETPVPEPDLISDPEPEIESPPPAPSTPPTSPLTPEPEISLDNLQKMLDDIARQIEELTQKIIALQDEEIIEPEEEEIDDCLVNINTASKEELQKIVGIGPVLAQRIIDARPFSSIYKLINVSGIGEITLQKIIEQGCAYVDEKDAEDEEIFEEESKEEITTAADICPVNINTASKDDLQAITGVGPVLSQRIIDARPFLSIYDLIRVSGIGEATLQKIIEQNCAFVEGDRGLSASPGSGSASASTPSPSPQITLNYSEENPVNEEIEVNLFASNFKNISYDLKISILEISEEDEQKRTLSEIYNENINDWQSSYNYIVNTFSETSFSGDFKLRIHQDKQDFKEKGEVIVKIRQSDNKKIVSEFRGEITITDPASIVRASFSFSPQNPIVDQEIVFDASSSASSDSEIVSYLWDFGDGITTTLAEATAFYSYSTPNVEYLASLWVIDDQGVTSLPATATIIVSELFLAENIIISEVQIADNEFVELYNPTNEDIDICPDEENCWYFSYFSANRDWNDPYRNKNFLEAPTTIVPAKGYYLIGLEGFPEENSNPNSDWQVYENKLLSDTAGAVGIFSCNPNIAPNDDITLEEAIAEAKKCKIDAFGWKKEEVDSPKVYRSNPFSFSEVEVTEKSFQRRKWQGFYIDSQNNSIDFEIAFPSPTNSKGERGNIFPPEKITDLSVSQIDDFTIELTWSAPFDPDTNHEDLSYDIRYLAGDVIDEENWLNSVQVNHSLEVAEASSIQALTISDLNYQTFYSFAIKTFDGKNYSFLSNVVFLETLLPQSPLVWPIFHHDKENTGQSPHIGPLTSEIRWMFEDRGRHAPTIDRDGTLYISTYKGLYALSSDGILKWFYEVPWVISTSVIDNNRVIYFFATEDLYAVNADGTLKWQEPLARYYSNMQLFLDIEGNLIFIGGYESSNNSLSLCLIKVDSKGLMSCLYEIEEEAPPSHLGNFSSPTIDSGGVIYFGYENKLFAINPDGSKKWELNFGGDHFGDYFVGTPTISNLDRTIYVSAGKFRAISFEGEIIWSSLRDVFTNLPAAISQDGTIYVSGSRMGHPGHAHSYLYAFDSFGDQKWEEILAISPFNYFSTPVVDKQGNVYVLGGHYLRKLDSEGEEVWGLSIGYTALSLSLGDRVIYAPGHEGLYAIGF